MITLNRIRLFLASLLLPLLTISNNHVIPGVINLMANFDKTVYTKQVQNSQEIPKDTFDFIIVGGGSAGSVLTNRLSEHFSVLLLERGGEPNLLTEIPAASAVIRGNPDLDYNSKTVPQSGACLASNDRRCAWNSGKGLGGSSNINSMAYFRGHHLDYEAWANITGDERWSYERVFPFFLKSEQYCVSCERHENDPTFNPLFHNTKGLLSISKINTQPLLEEFLQASEWDRIMRTDLNAPFTEGCAPIVFTQRNGKRCSTKVAFIDPIRGRPNLTIRKYARVYKLLLRDGSNEAYGVEYKHLGIHKVAYASKEIIVSTGTIETPKLLMLSGIGPKHHLQSLDIPVRVDLPVGKNLQDHFGTYVGPFLIKEGKSYIPERDSSASDAWEYVLQGTGLLTSPSLVASSFWVSSEAKKKGEEFWPDSQYLFVGFGLSTLLSIVPNPFNLPQSLYNAHFNPIWGRDAFFLLSYNSRPKSRGEITLASKDYHDDPLIDPKYYSDVEKIDIKVVIEGYKRGVNMAENAPSFKQLDSQLYPVPFPSCANITFRSDEYLECVIRHFSFTTYHYSGSASMGKVGSPNAVVDPELRVIGVKGLRVIDASIFPLVPVVNINGPTIMVAERGAQLILDTYLHQWRI